MKFKIRGADAITGKDRSVEIEADTEDSAATLARTQGLLPVRITVIKPPFARPVCPICSQPALVRRQKYRMSFPVVLIGYILLLPTILGILLGVLILMTGWTFGGFIGFLFIITSFVSGLLGSMLIMKKSVLQCSRCGAIAAEA